MFKLSIILQLCLQFCTPEGKGFKKAAVKFYSYLELSLGETLNLNEVAKLLRYRREDVKEAIELGVSLPKSGNLVLLAATAVGNDYEIVEEQLDQFILAFESEEPGRHPPAATRRTLLVEAKHKCKICCSDAPLHYHHIIEWSRLKHHDPEHMLAVCGSCHDKIHSGVIDRPSQRLYKNMSTDSPTGVLRADWTDIASILKELAASVGQSTVSSSNFDFDKISLDEKNKINKLGKDYFEMMVAHHQSHFHRIQSFLSDPKNRQYENLYHNIVDEIRSKLSANNNFTNFEQVLIWLYDSTLSSQKPEITKNRRLLNVLLSFMYFSCDIGKKH